MKTHVNRLFATARSVLCLNGDLPKFRAMPKRMAYVAVDGAATRLMQRGITPHLIVGDMDSIGTEALISGIPMEETPDQRCTDFEKALLVLRARNLLPTIVCGLTGREIDHYLNNLNILTKLSFEYPMAFYHHTLPNQHQVGLAVYGTLLGELPVQSTLSIMPFPQANVSTTGLTWELHHQELELTGATSVRNRTEKANFSIEVHRGVAVVIMDGSSLMGNTLFNHQPLQSRAVS